MDIIVEKEWYSRKMCYDNPHCIFVFGENQRQQGTTKRGAGQAIIRGCDNTFGFCTKASVYDYWTDEEYSENVDQIEQDIKSLKGLAKDYTIIFPYNGLGTGLSKLPIFAPRTFLYLSKRLLEVFGFNNLEGLKSK